MIIFTVCAYLICGIIVFYYIKGRIRQTRSTTIINKMIQGKDYQIHSYDDFKKAFGDLYLKFEAEAPKSITSSLSFTMEKIEPLFHTLVYSDDPSEKNTVAGNVFIALLGVIGFATLQLGIIFGNILLLKLEYRSFGLLLIVISILCNLLFSEVVLVKHKKTLLQLNKILIGICIFVYLFALLFNALILRW
jgi:hypothetical protein